MKLATSTARDQCRKPSTPSPLSLGIQSMNPVIHIVLLIGDPSPNDKRFCRKSWCMHVESSRQPSSWKMPVFVVISLGPSQDAFWSQSGRCCHYFKTQIPINSGVKAIEFRYLQFKTFRWRDVLVRSQPPCRTNSSPISTVDSISGFLP